MTELEKAIEDFKNKPPQLCKPSLIKISKEYKDFSGSLWLGREVTITEGVDDPGAAFKKAEQEMDTYFRSRNNPTITDFNTGQTASAPPVIDRRKTEIEEIINDCVTVDELVKVKDEVGKYGLIEIYADKLDKIKEEAK